MNSNQKKITWQFFVLVVFIGTDRVFGAPVPVGKENKYFPDLSTPIRVLIDRPGQERDLRTLGRNLYIQAKENPKWVAVSNNAHIQFTADGFRINSIPIRSQRVCFRNSSLSDPIQYQASIYSGVFCFSHAEKEILATNILPLDDYLVGTVAAEMSPQWEMEALKAQVVASRSYALHRIEHPKSKAYYDLEDSTLDQAYDGLHIAHKKIRTAVESTHNHYLAWKNHPVKAFFHSRCGGNTESTEFVWRVGDGPFKKTVKCPYCQVNRYTWISRWKTRELFQALGFRKNANPFTITQYEKSPTGRIAWLSLGPLGNEKKVRSDELRSILGYTKLKSAFFKWRIEPKEVVFEGVGAGHGVGMCQWGARYLAQQGKQYKEILQHYYPGVQMKEIGPVAVK